MIREVQPSEIPVPVAEYMTPIAWGGIYEGETLVGYGCLSSLHGQCWAHDLKHWGKDKTAVLGLYRLLRRLAKERGEVEFMTDVKDPEMIELYEHFGARIVSVILKGDI